MVQGSKSKGKKEERPEGAPADPLDDPKNQRKLELTGEFCQLLVRAIKSIGLYRHATGKFHEFIERPHATLTKVLDELGAVSFKVETQAFSLFNQDLLGSESGENIPYKFYKDGIRALIFRPGIEPEELLKFTLIAISDPKRGDEDILTQLWSAGFSHIEYILVEGFKIGDMSEDEVAIEVDKVVSYLYSRLRSSSDDYMRFARLNAEDLDIKLEGVDQLRGAVIVGESANEELKRRVADELREDQVKLFNKLVNVLFQSLEQGGSQDPAELRDTFGQVLDALLLQEDFASINQVLVKLRALDRNPQLADTARSLREFFINKMGESQRLDRIGELLKAGKPKNLPDIFRYMTTLDATAVIPLLNILDGLEQPENRQMICDVLAALGRDAPEPFVARINSERSQTVHDMLYIVDKCDHPDKLKIFASALKNKNLAVRIEALGVITRSRTEGARKMVVEALVDEAPQIRLGAARSLAKYDREKAVADILRVVRAPEFEKRDSTEKQGIYAALGATDSPGAFSFFQSVVEKKPSLLNKKRINEEKALAAHGLGSATSLAAFKLLQMIEQDKSADSELVGVARRSMFNVKKALTGDPNSNPAKS
jgi:hypothetical protein